MYIYWRLPLSTPNSLTDIAQSRNHCCCYFLVSPTNDDVMFSVNELTGEVFVNGTLDRETSSRYLVIVDVS